MDCVTSHAERGIGVQSAAVATRLGAVGLRVGRRTGSMVDNGSARPPTRRA
ncbi:hypothetical protein [Actinacidiphila glaucinigra]|uniref:hypothetical protein n=1 Tax=Actinacidiphila glaucinigra TaxID=235986 RepID=UPI003D8B0DD8